MMKMLVCLPCSLGASLFLYPAGNRGYHFSPIKRGANMGQRAGRQEHSQGLLPCLAARESRRAHSREAPGKQDPCLSFP